MSETVYSTYNPQPPVQAPVAYYAVPGYAYGPAQIQPVAPSGVPVAATQSLSAKAAKIDWPFWKGALLGVAVTLLVTNESIQKGTMKMISQFGAAAQSGLEEIKEKFEDAKAEAQAEV